MVGWVGGWVDGCMGGWVGGRVGGWVGGWLKTCGTKIQSFTSVMSTSGKI